MRRRGNPRIGWLPHWVLGVYGIATIALIPWIGFLTYTLPQRHLSRHWDLTWVVFDVALFLTLAFTAYLGHRRSGWIIVSATVLATLLLTDCWFDVSTARPGGQFALSLTMALCLEIPLAMVSLAVVSRTAMHLIRE